MIHLKDDVDSAIKKYMAAFNNLKDDFMNRTVITTQITILQTLHHIENIETEMQNISE